MTVPLGQALPDYEKILAEYNFDPPPAPKPSKSEPLKVVDAHTFLGLNLPVRETLLSPWLLAQSLSMIYARRGTGKTMLALSLSYALASGADVLGWQAPKPRKVLYIDGEMLAAPLQERLGGHRARFRIRAKTGNAEHPHPRSSKRIHAQPGDGFGTGCAG